MSSEITYEYKGFLEENGISCTYKDVGGVGGCKDTFKTRGELYNHLKSIDHTVHMSNLIENQQLEIQNTKQHLTNENNKLNEKIIQLSKELDSTNQKFNQLLNRVVYLENNNNNNSITNRWIISNYKQKEKECIVDSKHRIQSPNIKISGLDFIVDLYPNSNNKGYIGVYCGLLNFKEPVIVLIKFTIINNKDIDKSKTLETEFKFTSNCSHGFPEFLNGNKVSIDNGWLTKDGKLTLEFSLVLKNIIETN